MSVWEYGENAVAIAATGYRLFVIPNSQSQQCRQYLQRSLKTPVEKSTPVKDVPTVIRPQIPLIDVDVVKLWVDKLLQFSEQSGQYIMVGKEEKQNGKTIFRGFTNKSS